MRRAAKTDTNHAAVRDGLRSIGWSVADTSGAGDNFPDLVVGVGGRGLSFPPAPLSRGAVCDGEVYLVEVKPPKGKLRTGQQEFAWTWRGNYIVAETAEDVIEAVTVIRAARRVRGNDR